ncbi:MAG TPA: penicillin-binding protein, partial [Beijerinckiaceae bacterium]|nr:penicillin-binding protein [Beijerinckiaceae bacterium]
MLNKVVEEGTGKRAMLDGVKAGGKTGTTNAYRDAWFVGFTGNLVGAVWMGNDDHTSTNKMTGGSVPAMLWREVMAYAHQNIELKPIPYLGTPGPEVARAAASGAQGGVVQLGQPTSGALSRRSFEVLGGIGALLKGAERPVAPLSTLPGSARAAADLPSATGGTRAVGGRIALP